MISAVTFDAFGTIVDTGRDVLIRVARQVCEDHRPGLTPEALLDAWDRYFFAIDTEHFLTLRDVTSDALAKAFADFGIDSEPEPYIEILDRLWLQAKAYPEVHGVLESLDGVPRAVVSNADHEFLKDILARNDLRFDAVVTSESAQSYKPRPRIFEMALRALAVRPEDVVHVGDSLQADVEGASRLGMRTVWVNRSGLHRGHGDPDPDFEVKDLAPLPEILHRLQEME
jgi:2-haloalkanoic acid dehalogenase type II